MKRLVLCGPNSCLWCLHYGVWHLSNETLKLRWFPWNWMQSLPVLFPCCSQFIYRVVTVLYRCFWLLDNSLQFLPRGIQWDFLSLKGLLPLRWYWEELSLHFHFFWKSASEPVNGYVKFWKMCNYSSKTINNTQKEHQQAHHLHITQHYFYAKLQLILAAPNQGPFAWVKLSICQ